MTNNKAWTISVAASILLVVGVFVGLFGAGFRVYTVKTPSMGTVAPVGTLVAVHEKSSYGIGDVITYERNGVSYTHRIVDENAQGFVTKGDINGAADALPVTTGEIVGSVVFYGKYLGFVVQGLPWIVVGWLIVYVLTLLPRVRATWRWQIRFIGWSLVLSAVAAWLKPWVNLVMLGYVPADGGGASMHLVNTGVFPVNVLGTVLRSGQDAVVTQTIADSHGRYTVIPQLALTFGWFCVLLAICLTPMVLSMLVRVEDVTEGPEELEEAAAAEVEPPRLRRVLPLALVIAATVVVVSLALQWSTHAAFASTVTNSNNSVGTRTYFTCRNAVSSLGASGTYLAWALGTGQNTGTNETDLSGNGRSGRYAVTSTTFTTSVGCNQDTPKAAVNFNGTSQCLYVNANYATTGYAPNTFSLEAWFRTGTTSNGKIIGFGTSRNGVGDTNWDRHIYLDKDGRIVFGVYPGAVELVYTAAGVNYADNQWHHVVATLSTAGQFLYVDGNLAMSQPTVTTAEGVSGYWKVGCGNLSNWRNAATDAAGSTALDYTGPSYFTGQIQYAAVYTSALTLAQVKQHYAAGA